MRSGTASFCRVPAQQWLSALQTTLWPATADSLRFLMRSCRYVEPTLEHCKRNLKAVVPLPAINQVQTLCKASPGIFIWVGLGGVEGGRGGELRASCLRWRPIDWHHCVAGIIRFCQPLHLPPPDSCTPARCLPLDPGGCAAPGGATWSAAARPPPAGAPLRVCRDLGPGRLPGGRQGAGATGCSSSSIVAGAAVGTSRPETLPAGIV
jgi:hypothetical protein